MLKHQEFILNLSLKEKLALICSREKLKQSYGPNLDLDSFEIEKEPTFNCDNHGQTYFPSDKLLASSFDYSLIRKIYKFKAIESKNLGKSIYYNVSTNFKKENISEDYLISGFFLKEKLNGLLDGDAITNIEKYNQASKMSFDNEVIGSAYDLLLTGQTPTSLTLNTLDEYLDAKTKFNFSRLSYVSAKTMEETVALFNNGITMINILFANTEDEFNSFIMDKVLGYRRAIRDFKDNRITESKFVEMISEGYIVNEDNINTAVDNVIDLLTELKNNSTYQEIEKPRAISFDGSKSYFDEVLHDNYAYIAAKEGTVLLKNKDNILPFSFKNKIAVFGEYAKDTSFQEDLFGGQVTKITSAFDAINDYDDINAIGFAYGYKNGQINDVLLAPALNLATEADYLLVYLCAKPNETSLPNEQIELLRQLHQVNPKIIAVVSSDGAIDLSFDQYCYAILMTYRPGQEGIKAILDILIGDDNPSGKLVESIPEVLEFNSDDKLAQTYYNNELPVRYCFGYGLSYSKFIYKNLEINENGLYVSITNDSSRPATCIPQLYVEKPDSQSSLSRRLFKGSARVFLQPKETLRAFIPFDDFTFRYYDEKRQKFGIEGGYYEIYVGDSLEDIRLKGSINLKRTIFNIDDYDSTQEVISDNIEDALEDFIKKDSNVDVYATIDKNEKKTKRTLRILTLLYVDIILAVVGYIYFEKGNNIVAIVMAACLLVFSFIMKKAIKNTRKDKKKKKSRKKTATESLADLVNSTKEFKEIAKVTYTKPVHVVDPIDDKVGQKVKDAKLKDDIAKKNLSYDTTFNVQTASVDEFASEPSLDELVSNMVDFFSINGIEIEYSSLRNLISCMSASKLTFIRCDNTELLPKFTSLLNRFFGNNSITVANETWSKPFDLYWKEENGKFVPSEFVNIIKAANDNPKRAYFDILENVNISKSESYLTELLKHLVFTAEEVKLALNESFSLTIPNNVYFILVPNDYAYLDDLNAVYANVCQVCDIVISKPIEARVDDGHVPSTALLTMEHFYRTIRDGKKSYFIKEDEYKSLDEFESIIGAKTNFKIGNKNALAIENYVSCFMSCGGDDEDAFIYAFISKIVPLLKSTPLFKDDVERSNLLNIIEKCFTNTDLTKIKKSLHPVLLDRQLKLETEALSMANKTEQTVDEESIKSDDESNKINEDIKEEIKEAE